MQHHHNNNPLDYELRMFLFMVKVWMFGITLGLLTIITIGITIRNRMSEHNPQAVRQPTADLSSTP